jgi:hypothetical protein
VCGRVDGLEFDRGEFAEGTLTTAPMFLDEPGHLPGTEGGLPVRVDLPQVWERVVAGIREHAVEVASPVERVSRQVEQADDQCPVGALQRDLYAHVHILAQTPAMYRYRAHHRTGDHREDRLLQRHAIAATCESISVPRHDVFCTSLAAASNAPR